jgi:thiosulfate reductase cytochrome b subunit
VKTLAYGLSIICVIVAVLYFVLPGGSLPTFLPGYVAGSTHVHKMHGFAAATAAIVFLLIGLSTQRR